MVSASSNRATAARNAGTRVLLNPAPVHYISQALVDLADIICPNQVEAEALLADQTRVDPLQQAELLSSDDRIAVITLGARGAVYAAHGQSGSVSPPLIDAVDATAAGDSFCAGLALALVEGQSIVDALRFGCAAGAHAATIRGAEPSLPTRADVEALLRQV